MNATGQTVPGVKVSHTLRLALVEKDGAGDSLAPLFAGRDDVAVVHVMTIAKALHLVDGQQADAVLLDPELPEGWPATIAEQMVEGVAGRTPVLICCRSASDATVIGDRLSAQHVLVLQREHFSAQVAVQFFLGAGAAKRTKPSAA